MSGAPEMTPGQGNSERLRSIKAGDFSDDRRWRPSWEDDPRNLLTREQWNQVKSAAQKGFHDRAHVTNLLATNGLLWKPDFGFEPPDLDGPKYHVYGLPLAVVHSESDVDLMPLCFGRSLQDDWIDVEMSGRRCAEVQEKIILGVYEDHTVYGLCSHPKRQTMSVMTAEDENWEPRCLPQSVSSMVDKLYLHGFYGPYGVVCGQQWQEQLTRQPLADSVSGITGIRDVVGPPTITPNLNWDIVVFQLTPDVIRLVAVQEPTVIWWDGKIKVVLSMTPQLRADFQGNCGIAHASPSVG